MIARIEGLAGIKNVGDSRRRTKIVFDGNGDCTLAGDVNKCVNFRIGVDALGEVRNGQTLKLTGTSIKRYWTNKAENIALFTDGVNLKSLNSNLTTATTLYSLLTAGKRMEFVEIPDRRTDVMLGQANIYMGNGAQMLKYDPNAGTVTTWGDATLIPEEFETPQATYMGPPLSNILMNYRARAYVASGRYAFYSDSNYPQRFKSSWYLTAPEDITAMSYDTQGIYLHTRNLTIPFMGQDPGDFQMIEPVGIGAILHGAFKPGDSSVPFIFSKKGIAVCSGGQVKYLDDESPTFRLDLSDTAEAFLGYDPINRETIWRIKA